MKGLPTIYTRDKLRDFCAARDRGELCRVDDHLFNYFLEVLPPIYMGRMVTLVDGRTTYAIFGFAEGAERITAFWGSAGAYFAQHTTMFSRGG